MIAHPVTAGLLALQPSPAATPVGEAPQVPAALARLKSVILLAGSVGTGSLAAAAGRAVIGMPLEQRSLLLDHWRSQVGLLAQVWGLEELDLRVLGNDRASLGAGTNGRGSPHVSIECDPQELRGAGGALRDASAAYGGRDFVMVAAAGQLLVDSLAAAAGELAEAAADVALFADDVGTPGSVMLVRCGALAEIPVLGFIDLKEQGLPRIARQYRVRVVRRSRPLALPLRTRADYVRALRWYHQVPRPDPIHDPFAEDWQPVFALQEDGAQVNPAARLHDSVVLAGGRVERGAMVVRSVICAGGIAARNQIVVDQVITSARH